MVLVAILAFGEKGPHLREFLIFLFDQVGELLLVRAALRR